MKSTIKPTGLILFILSLFLICSCKKDKPVPPTITTSEVTEVSYTTAVSGGNVKSEGGAPVISRGICWNTSADPTIANSKKAESGTQGSFASNMTQLTPNTMYYVKAYATNSAGTSYGEELTFTTNQVAVPVLTTAEITSITQRTAVSGGNITDDKGGSVTARGVCWGVSENPTISDSKTSDASGIGIFASSLIGLIGNTTYYVRAYATNSVGTQYGNQVSFKTSPLIMPVLSTVTVSSISFTSCTSGGNISDDGGASITIRGVCWSTSQNPTTLDNRTENGPGKDAFVSSITGLTDGTTYFIRAYATNSVGTQYGNQLSFTTYPSNMTDIDGNVYNVVLIGSQLWMAENLKTATFNDGTVIPDVTNSATWAELSGPALGWYNNNAAAAKATYGALYNWYTVSTGKLCATGWHVPTIDEWTELRTYLGGEIIAGNKLREIGTTHWADPNTEATNSSGFTALPGGYRNIDGTFSSLSFLGDWWSSSESNSSNAYGLFLYNDNSSLHSEADNKHGGFSVRCIKD
jgi:uncharacterized protein (TIGR02145 family)